MNYQINTKHLGTINAGDEMHAAWATWDKHRRSERVAAGDEMIRIEPSGERVRLTWIPRAGETTGTGKAYKQEDWSKRAARRREAKRARQVAA